MTRPATLLSLAAALGSGLYLYAEKHQAGLLDRQIGQVFKATQEARAQTEQLRAEWGLLNDPARLQGMADKYLPLKPIEPAQYVQLEQLGDRLPGVGGEAPVAAPVPSAAAPVVVADVSEPQVPDEPGASAPAVDAPDARAPAGKALTADALVVGAPVGAAPVAEARIAKAPGDEEPGDDAPRDEARGAEAQGPETQGPETQGPGAQRPGGQRVGTPRPDEPDTRARGVRAAATVEKAAAAPVVSALSVPVRVAPARALMARMAPGLPRLAPVVARPQEAVFARAEPKPRMQRAQMVARAEGQRVPFGWEKTVPEGRVVTARASNASFEMTMERLMRQTQHAPPAATASAVAHPGTGYLPEFRVAPARAASPPVEEPPPPPPRAETVMAYAQPPEQRPAYPRWASVAQPRYMPQPYYAASPGYSYAPPGYYGQY